VTHSFPFFSFSPTRTHFPFSLYDPFGQKAAGEVHFGLFLLLSLSSPDTFLLPYLTTGAGVNDEILVSSFLVFFPSPAPA